MGLVLDDIGDLVSTGGVSTTQYLGFLPERPDEALGFFESGGLGPVHAMAGGPGLAVEEAAGIQVIRRSASYRRARVEMAVIFRLLDGFGDRVLDGTRYSWIEAVQSPFSLGQDESGRSMVACNFLVWKALTTSTST
jgi:hypothetical protein